MTTLAVPTPTGLLPNLRPTLSETAAVTIPPSAHTLDGFRAWAHSGELPAACRVTYIGGKVTIDMSPERAGSHGAVKMEVTRVLYGLCRERDLGQFFPDGTLVSNRTADVSNEPDAIFVAHATFASGRARRVPSADGRDFVEIAGSPDFILEVVSPSSVNKDTILLREAYHAAGVAEYWLIDARADELQFEILRHTPTHYEPAPAQGGWLTSEVFGARFRLTRQQHQAGFLQYTLHVAPPDVATA
ncbi:MAG TPA: Uma2 family endonuclease [Gemmataceae bacterium]|nr:Uma2 family endonuclease [Gemmataceae bacterium]